MRARLIALLNFISQPVVAIGGALVIAVIAVGATWYLTSVSPNGTYTLAATSTIDQEVQVSGTVQGAETTNLSFQIAGQVASIPVVVGEHVGAGQVLVALAGGTQSAALLGAQANLEAAQANLAALQAGTRSEQLAIDQNAVTQDQAGLADEIQSAYVAADTAVHADADQFFTNPRTASAALTITVPDSTLATRLINERIALEPVLAAWSTQVTSSSLATADLSTSAATATQNLAQVSTFLDDAASALSQVQASPSMTTAMLAAYEQTIGGARTSIAGAISGLTGAQSALTSAEGTLTLAQAGATPQAIAAAQAQVDVAQAAVDSAQVSSNETALVAPISGTVTAQNANPGEAVTPDVPLVSLESDSSFEVKAPVSQSDIAKVKVGQPVTATFDAYPGITFPATITEVDPAATITNGVASYNITATFTANDSRVQGGMTAHLSILTDSVVDAIVVPTSAIITSGTSQFVYVHASGGDVETPVTTGIESPNGMIQILSGVSVGQEVLSFGSAQ